MSAKPHFASASITFKTREHTQPQHIYQNVVLVPNIYNMSPLTLPVFATGSLPERTTGRSLWGSNCVKEKGGCNEGKEEGPMILVFHGPSFPQWPIDPPLADYA
uniref:Uncharacterized protein n=1 Tax=Sphaerodactylus townsendi TaxID=933632 RepID=A0ACB8FNB3_9SAUR